MMKRSLPIALLAGAVLAASVCGCSNSASGGGLTKQQVQQFGTLGQKPPPGYSMAAVRARFKKLGLKGAPP